jgi:hypothetical protein
MSNSNIVTFPGLHRIHPPQNETELKEHAQAVRLNFVTKHCTDFAFDVFRTIEKHGFDLSGPNIESNIKYDMILISEAIKSTLLRSMGEKHPLQEFAENIINLQDSDIVFDDEEFEEQ